MPTECSYAIGTKCQEYKVNKNRHNPGPHRIYSLDHRWQTQGLHAESGPPPCFIRPGTLFLPGGSTDLSLN